MMRYLCVVGFLLVPLAADASAQPPGCLAPAPVVTSYYAPAPVVTSYYAPAVSYYAPAPAVSYYAPAVSYYAPAPSVTSYRYGVLGLRRLDVVNYGAPVVAPAPVRSYYYAPRTIIVP